MNRKRPLALFPFAAIPACAPDGALIREKAWQEAISRDNR